MRGGPDQWAFNLQTTGPREKRSTLMKKIVYQPEIQESELNGTRWDFGLGQETSGFYGQKETYIHVFGGQRKECGLPALHKNLSSLVCNRITADRKSVV